MRCIVIVFYITKVLFCNDLRHREKHGYSQWYIKGDFCLCICFSTLALRILLLFAKKINSYEIYNCYHPVLLSVCFGYGAAG